MASSFNIIRCQCDARFDRPRSHGAMRRPNRISANAAIPVGAAEYITTFISVSCNGVPHADPAASGMIELPEARQCVDRAAEIWHGEVRNGEAFERREQKTAQRRSGSGDDPLVPTDRMSS